MSLVYLEPSALALGGVPETPAGPAQGYHVMDVIAPGAREGVTYLREAGFEAVILSDDDDAGSALGTLVDPPVAVEPRLPEPVPSGTWLVTGDPERCQHRPAGVRTLLVGPRRPPTKRPTAHCDAEARDLATAVLQILADEAMVVRR